MKYLKKTWVRVVVSLFAGGVVSELIHISTGDPNRPMTSNFTILYTFIIYSILTRTVKKTSNGIK
jgi:hypothetical protein